MTRFVSCACVVVLASAILAAQQKPNWVDPAKFTQPPTTSWPTYNGDYSGRRFSPLKNIDDSGPPGGPPGDRAPAARSAANGAAA